MITGTLAKFGSTYLLNLQFLDVRAARVMREASLKLKSNSDDQLLDVVGRAVAQILPAEPAEPPAPSISAPIESTSPTPIREVSVTEPAAATRSHVLGWTLIGGAVASAAVAAVGGIEVLNYTNLDSQLKSQKIPAGVTYQSALGQRNAANGWADASLVLVGVAVACGVGAVVTW
jgi:hypothetical protein